MDDPRKFPDAAAAPAECADLHALAAASQSVQGLEAAALDTQVVRALRAMLEPGQGDRLSAAFATAPSVAVHRHLWRLLVECERELARTGAGEGVGDEAPAVTVFALPLVIVAGIAGEQPAQATISGVLDDAATLATILREHGALAGNLSFALANVLTSTAAIDLARLPEIFSWRALPQLPTARRELEPAPIALLPGPETVHVRFLLGSAIAAPGANLLSDDNVGKWGIPFAHALGRQLAASVGYPDGSSVGSTLGSPAGSSVSSSGVSLLALPRAPQTLLRAARQGRASQREVGAHIFASNAIRKLRASVGEPTAVISAHRAPDAIDGGEVRLSLSSPFDPREAEGFRCPLYPLDRVEDVVAMLTDLLVECRVTDVRVVAGVHADRDSSTGLPLLFKGDTAPASMSAVH